MTAEEFVRDDAIDYEVLYLGVNTLSIRLFDARERDLKSCESAMTWGNREMLRHDRIIFSGYIHAL